MLRAGQADTFALGRDSLQSFVAEFPGSHIVDGGFQQTGIAIAAPKGHPEALAYVTKFIEDGRTWLLRAVTAVAVKCDGAFGSPVINRHRFWRLTWANYITRLTTMHVVTASIAHEVNQPLAAIVANGNAALRWLQRTPPEVAEAATNVNRIISDGHRASKW
jgi:hypothetical protein